MLDNVECCGKIGNMTNPRRSKLQIYGVSVKVEKESYRLIKNLAKRSGRTIQGQISHVLEWYITQVGKWPLK